MPNKFTESGIEDFAIKLFERLGYSYVYVPDIASDGEQLERGHCGEVLLAGRLVQALKRINAWAWCFIRGNQLDQAV